jgi:hypothetical protein
MSSGIASLGYQCLDNVDDDNNKEASILDSYRIPIHSQVTLSQPTSVRTFITAHPLSLARAH